MKLSSPFPTPWGASWSGGAVHYRSTAKGTTSVSCCCMVAGDARQGPAQCERHERQEPVGAAERHQRCLPPRHPHLPHGGQWGWQDHPHGRAIRQKDWSECLPCFLACLKTFMCKTMAQASLLQWYFALPMHARAVMQHDTCCVLCVRLSLMF